jgi:hypothetical protein
MVATIAMVRARQDAVPGRRPSTSRRPFPACDTISATNALELYVIGK